MKTLKNLTLTQKAATFNNSDNEQINYKQYLLQVGAKAIKVKAVNGEGKVRLEDAFDGKNNVPIEGLTLTQKPASFNNKDNEQINYKQYTLQIGAREIKVKAVNGEGKVRLEDAFDLVKDN